MFETASIIEKYCEVAERVIANQYKRINESADCYDPDEIEELKLTVEMAEYSLALQRDMAEKLDQICDKLEILLGKI